MITTPTANSAWILSLKKCLNEGIMQSPKGMHTLELINDHISFDMDYPICYHQDRKLSYSFMAAEAYWIVSGSMFVEDIAPYNKHIAQFSDDGHIFNGAYGPKFIYQVDYVVNALLKDINTRQAVMTIWIPNPMSTKDYACTLNIQWLIRNNQLHCIVNMRSNDLWLGRPYDIFNFTIMSLRVLTLLNSRLPAVITLGKLHLNVGSAHLYEKDWEAAKKVVENKTDKITYSVPYDCFFDWELVVNSLWACRDQNSTDDLWEIRR